MPLLQAVQTTKWNFQQKKYIEREKRKKSSQVESCSIQITTNEFDIAHLISIQHCVPCGVFKMSTSLKCWQISLICDFIAQWFSMSNNHLNYWIINMQFLCYSDQHLLVRWVDLTAFSFSHFSIVMEIKVWLSQIYWPFFRNFKYFINHFVFSHVN